MYTAREVSTVLGLSQARLRTYLRTGYVSPRRGEDGELRFSFQDLVLLRNAEGLVTERIAPRRVHHALRKLRERLPDDLSLMRVRLAAEGKHILVDDGVTRWHPESGQVVFDFERPSAGGLGATVTSLASARPEPPAPRVEAPRSENRSAQEHYERGCALEESAPAEAREAYRKAVELDPRFADAHVNLGRLLHETGDINGALGHYRAALAVRPDDATAAFNVGVALEDLGSLPDAIEAYRRALGSDPNNADAHYNLARLLEQTGRPDEAVRHLLIYRRLTRKR